MASPGSSMSFEELVSFHRIDREMYQKLVIELGHDLMQSMEMIALWVWLEEVGYPNIIQRMLYLPNNFVNSVAKEALTCFDCMVSPTPPPPNCIDLPQTLTLMDGKHISLMFMFENRERALTKTLKTVTVFTRAFRDIFQQVALSPVQASNLVGPGNGPSGYHPSLFQQSQIPHIKLHPIVFGSRNMSVPPLLSTRVRGGEGGRIIETGESSSLLPSNSAQSYQLNLIAEPYDPTNNYMFNDTNEVDIMDSTNVVEENIIPPEDRTMFITFSRGYPIPENDVRDFFFRTYGDCVEGIYMQEVPPNKQSLYAKVIFSTASKIMDILEGAERVKFTINGRHMWGRRYETKRSRSPPPPPLPAAAAIL